MKPEKHIIPDITLPTPLERIEKAALGIITAKTTNDETLMKNSITRMRTAITEYEYKPTDFPF